MNRRDALFSSSAMVVSASLGAIACGARNAVANGPAMPRGAIDGSLLDTAYDCLRKGDACVAHCVMLLGTGDTSMAGCAAAVHDMVASVEALTRLAQASSRHLPYAAGLAMETCKTCEEECRKHADKHLICKECADSCARTVAAAAKAAG